MPYMETPEELAEAIADMCGVYGVPPYDREGHSADCNCRMCFYGRMENRIREAVKNEKMISGDEVIL
jgi:hypothetical protein